MTAPSAIGLLIFFLAPVATLLCYSALTSGRFSVGLPFTADNYVNAIDADTTPRLAWNSILVGAIASTTAVGLGLPIASWLRYHAGRPRDVVLFVVIVTMFASYLVRIYAFRLLLGEHGAINTALESLGLIDRPLAWLLFSRFAVICALVHIALPYVVLILYGAFAPLQPAYLEAAEDLGAGAIRKWTRVVLPLMAAPIASAFLLTFVLTSSDYVTPQFLGGPNQQMLGVQVQASFKSIGDWGGGAALSFIMLAAYLLCYALMALGLRIARLHDMRWTS